MGNTITRLSKSRPRAVGRQVVRREEEKRVLVESSHAASLDHEVKSQPQMNNKEQLCQGDMAKALAGVITSRSETFVDARIMNEKVPSKEINDARKRHRLNTKDLRHLLEVIRENPGVDVETVCRKMQYDANPERIQTLTDTVALPMIRKDPSGGLIAVRDYNSHDTATRD